MIVLDESPSMAARDLGGDSRFATAVEVIRGFVAGRENDAIGVVSFSDRAALQVPKTLDRVALNAALERLRVMTLGDATAIGMGIAVALLHLQDSAAAGRVIILLTDGENNAGEISPRTAAAIAADKGVRIYTIGVGRAGATVLELTDPRSGLTRRGVYHGRFDEALLRRVAEITGGRYFAATEPGRSGRGVPRDRLPGAGRDPYPLAGPARAAITSSFYWWRWRCCCLEVFLRRVIAAELF